MFAVCLFACLLVCSFFSSYLTCFNHPICSVEIEGNTLNCEKFEFTLLLKGGGSFVSVTCIHVPFVCVGIPSKLELPRVAVRSVKNEAPKAPSRVFNLQDSKRTVPVLLPGPSDHLGVRTSGILPTTYIGISRQDTQNGRMVLVGGSAGPGHGGIQQTILQAGWTPRTQTG